MSEGQAGVPLTLDVGVLDMATCEPLENVLVDFWHCNATGSYSSFTALSPNTPFLELLQSLNISSDDCTYRISTTEASSPFGYSERISYLLYSVLVN